MHDLEITWHDGRARFSPKDSPVAVGRSPEAAVILTDPAVSRRHLEFVWLGASWIANDSSTHGSFDPIGVRLAPTWTVGPDTRLRLGGVEGTEVSLKLVTATEPVPTTTAEPVEERADIGSFGHEVRHAAPGQPSAKAPTIRAPASSSPLPVEGPLEVDPEAPTPSVFSQASPFLPPPPPSSALSEPLLHAPYGTTAASDDQPVLAEANGRWPAAVDGSASAGTYRRRPDPFEEHYPHDHDRPSPDPFTSPDRFNEPHPPQPGQPSPDPFTSPDAFDHPPHPDQPSPDPFTSPDLFNEPHQPHPDQPSPDPFTSPDAFNEPHPPHPDQPSPDPFTSPDLFNEPHPPHPDQPSPDAFDQPVYPGPNGATHSPFGEPVAEALDHDHRPFGGSSILDSPPPSPPPPPPPPSPLPEPDADVPLAGHEPGTDSPLTGHEPGTDLPLTKHEPGTDSPLTKHEPGTDSPLGRYDDGVAAGTNEVGGAQSLLGDDDGDPDAPEPAQPNQPRPIQQREAEAAISDSTLQLSVDGQNHVFFPGTKVTVGRDPSSLVRLDERHAMVSRRHLEINHYEDDWWIEDFSSKGTYVDRHKLAAPYRAEGAFLVHLGDDDTGTTMRVITAGEHRVPRSQSLVLLVAIGVLGLIAILALVFALGGDDAAGDGALVGDGSTVTAADLAVAKQATVLLLSPEGTGSGFFVSDNLIVTNQHVAVLAPSLSVAVSRTVDEPAVIEFRAETVALHPFLDIAALKLTVDRSGSPVVGAGLQPVSLGDTTALAAGDQVYNTGFPEDLALMSSNDLGNLLLPAVSAASGEAASFSVWPGCSNPTHLDFIPIGSPPGVRCAPDGDLERGIFRTTFSNGQGASGSPVFRGSQVVGVVFSGPQNENEGRIISSTAFATWLDGVVADNR